MSDPQIIRTPGGEELVVLTRGEYEELVNAARMAEEDEEDVAIYDARIADLAAGREGMLPDPVSAALLRGERLLRALRKWRGLTQDELAAKCGITQGYLSDIEAGRRVGAAETLATVANALDIPGGWIASQPSSE